MDGLFAVFCGFVCLFSRGPRPLRPSDVSAFSVCRDLVLVLVLFSFVFLALAAAAVPTRFPRSFVPSFVRTLVRSFVRGQSNRIE